MTAGVVLAVDDERIVLRIIREHLEANDFEVVTAINGAEALEILNAEPERFDVVVLDRMMPVMDGMEVLRAIRLSPQLVHLPVVMQTAATAPRQVQEGIDAGAFYYVTKPYDEETLVSIVRSAVRNCTQTRDMLRTMVEGTMGADLLSEGVFEFRTPEQAKSVAWMLGQQAEHSLQVIIGLVELMNNAIQHGNLGIGEAEKNRLVLAGELDREIFRRLCLPENTDKLVRVSLRREAGRIQVAIKDQGAGFDWARYLEIRPEQAYQDYGKGIMTARSLAFDSMEYGDGGSLVAVGFVANIYQSGAA